MKKNSTTLVKSRELFFFSLSLSPALSLSERAATTGPERDEYQNRNKTSTLWALKLTLKPLSSRKTAQRPSPAHVTSVAQYTANTDSSPTFEEEDDEEEEEEEE